MNNEQLLQRLQDNLPEDLSLEEIELLRDRVRESPELRDALAGHLQWEQFLATGLARGHVSPEQIENRLRVQRNAARARTWRRFGWPLALLVACGLALAGARAWKRWQAEPVAELARLPEKPAERPAVAANTPTSKKPASAEAAPEASVGKAEAVDPLAQFSTEKPRPFSQSCFEPLASVQTEADLARLKALWQPVGGSMAPGRKKESNGVVLSGRFTLRTPWPAGQVLRLAPIDLDRMSIEISGGPAAVSLRYTDKPSPQWGAYGSRQPHVAGQAGDLLLAATDDDRYRRTSGGVIELRYQNGLVVLSRGDVLLLAAPLASKPERVVLEVPSKAMLGNMVFAPGEDFPLSPESALPAEQKPTALAGTLPPDVVQTFEPGGACQLTAKDNSKPGWVTLEVPEPGTQEVTLRIDAVSPGAGVVLVDSDDRVVDGVGFLNVKRSQQMALAYNRPNDRTQEFRDNGRGLAPLVSTPCWLRILAGPSLKCWTSLDGRHWALALDGRPTGHWQRLGIYCSAGKGTRTIRASAIGLRKLPALGQMAEKNSGRALASALDPGTWLADALAAQPADVKRSHWLQACASRTLAAGCRRELARPLIQSLLEQAPEMGGSLEARADFIDELALLSDPYDSTLMRQVVEAYVTLARGRGDAKPWQPYSRIRRRLVESPPLARIKTASLVEPLIRAEIFELVDHDAWDELDRLCKQVEFFESPSRRRTSPSDQPGQLIEWAAALARRNRPAAGEPSGTIPALWRHPLVEQLGKEGFNILAELNAALAGGSYKDACQIISSVTPREAVGLLPTANDSALLVSLPGAVALAMHDHPPLVQMMQSEFAPLGQLRLRQATTTDDLAGVEAVTIQFYGTTAARQAHLWLGDRALSAGDFSEAEAHYRRASEIEAGQPDASIAARVRLAAAMQGRSVGSKAEEPVQLGAETISAVDFEQMIDRMLARSTASRSHEAGTASWRPVPAGAPEPADYRTRRLTRLGLAQVKRSAVPDGMSWDPVACETSLTLSAKSAIVAGPGEIAAYQRLDGHPLWKFATGQPPQRGNYGPPGPRRVAMGDGMVFARRWSGSGWQLIALDAGKLAWQTPPSVRVASDPVLLDDRVLVVTSATMPQELLELSLAAYDPRSGQQLAQHPLAQFRDVWQRDLACELGVAGDTVVVVGGGCTTGCSRDGEPRWLRRETWVGGVIDQRTWPRRYDPPLTSGRLVCVAQPGVPTVSAVEVSNGLLAWQRPMADLVRMLAIISGKLIVQTARGFEALSLENGSTVWQHDAPQALDGWLAGDSAGFVFAKREMIGNRRSRVRLVWLDTKSGNQRASTLLTDWQPEQAMFGPLASDGPMIWAMAGASTRDSSRELFELTAQGPAAERTGEPWIDQWLAGSPLLAASGALLPGWHLLSGVSGEPTGVVADSAGRQTAVVTRASAVQPARWLRRVSVPEQGPAVVRIELGPIASEPWELIVAVDNQAILQRSIARTTASQAPAAVEADLAKHRGKTVWLSVTQGAVEGRWSLAAWKRLEVPTETETRPGSAKPSP